MDLSTLIIPATVGKSQSRGSIGFSAVAGKTLKIEISPAGLELHNQTVPAGKKWINGRVTLFFDEVDA